MPRRNCPRRDRPRPLPRLAANPDSPARFGNLPPQDQDRLMRWLKANVTGGVADSRDIWMAYRAATGHHIPHGAVIGAMYRLGHHPAFGDRARGVKRFVVGDAA